MTDVLKPASRQRRSSTTYLAFPLSLFRRRHSTQSHKTSPPPSTLASNDPLSEVIDIGQSSSTSQHTYSHADESPAISPEDEERQRLRDAAAQSLGLDLDAFSDDNPNGASTDSSPPSRPPLKPSNTISYGYETSSHPSGSGLPSSLTASLPNPMIYNPQPLNIPTKLPPYPCSYSQLAPFIQISSSYLKFAAGPTNTTHTSSGFAFIPLPKRSKSMKTQWKLYYVVLTVPREYGSRALPSVKHSSLSQSPPVTGTSSSFHSLASPTRFHTRSSPPPLSFMPNHSHLHLFKSEHPTRDEMEVDRLEINEDTVVYVADIELSGKKGLIKVTGRHVGATTATMDDEELSRTLWILKYPDPREATNATLNNKVIYPDESEVQQRWVREIKSSVLSQRAERAGFLHASSQPTSPRSSWLSNSGYASPTTNHGWHLPISPNRQLSFFPQPRPSPPILPPPNPNPRYAEHVGAAPSSAVSSLHPTSANSSSSRLYSPNGTPKFTGLRSLFQSPLVGGSPSLRDDNSITTKNGAASPIRTASRPSSRDGAGSVWSGTGVGIQRTTIKEEEKDGNEMSRHKDIHPLAPDEPTEDYASFLTRLNTKLKESLKVKEKEDKRRPKSAGAVSDNTAANETMDMTNADVAPQHATNQNGSISDRVSQLHPTVNRPSSPLNDMSVASIYSQSSAQDQTTKGTRSSRHSHKKSASTGTIGTSLLQTLQNQNVAEWVVSTTHAQAQGEVQTDKDSADTPVSHGRHRHNDRLSIGESLAISLSLKPRPRSQRRSTTINALAASALKEDWSFPPLDNSAAASDGTETPGRTDPYSRPLTATLSHATPFRTVSSQGPHLPEQPQISISPPSPRSSVHCETGAAHTTPRTESRNANFVKTVPQDEGENRTKDESSATDIIDNDTYTYHSEEDRARRPIPAKPVRISSILNSTSSPFGRPTPLVYKRVSAPPATSSSSNPMSGNLPPLRPPPSFAPPPPPSDPHSISGTARSSEETTTSTKASSEMGKAKDSVGPSGKGTEGASSLSRPFRLSLNPSPAPTQPLPPRPDEVTVDGTVTIMEAQNDKPPVRQRQRQRPHSTLAGPRQKPYKTFTMDNERPLFMSMYPASVSASIPVGANDPPGPMAGSSVPAPQPPPQGPLPPTPELTAVENSRGRSTGLTPISSKGPQHSSATRRLRIMSSPPPPKSGYEFDDNDETNVNNRPVSYFVDERAEPIRPRFLIPAPPRIPPPKPRKESGEQILTVPYSTSSGELSPLAEHGDSTFLYMDDTPKASIFPTATDSAAPVIEVSLETRLFETDTQTKPDNSANESILFTQGGPSNRPSTDHRSSVLWNSQIPETSTLKNDRNATLPYDTHEISISTDSYETSEKVLHHGNELKLAEVDIGTGATVVMGRIKPPSHSSPLSTVAQTRSNSPSDLSSDSCLQYERSVEDEREEDFNY